MKKLKQIVATVVLVLAPFTTAGIAAADTCEIGYTGPNSENLCVSEQEYTCTVTNENEVTIDQTNQQITVSGDANNTDNTNGGGAQSGSATNENNVTFNVTVENDEVCTVVATVPATPTPTTSEPEVTVTPEETSTPAVLAPTASDSTAKLLVMLGAITGVATLATLAITRIVRR